MNNSRQNISDNLERFSGISLIIGGARSGKSRFGEQLALALDNRPTYLATAESRDEEMRDRIAKHQNDRGTHWITIEEPLAIAEQLKGQETVLIDCLTLWLNNLMEHQLDIDDETEKLVEVLQHHRGNAIMISNEVGLGIVPDNALARSFRDQAGRLNQHIAQAADHVFYMAAGLPMVLKRDGRPTWGEGL
ncbi:bifunctional adenosylcobinamide kinase/adenosylcobinamide-phosphate guanylyltransferase [Emcibacter nanhaiensis]|uniref:Bifunctional adenosylcobalamin biosynthesis protein n=1 Tax=Emcibacter nanhaiensis TaxID=1505037 RepID=A0A501PLB4_9PROT|nr:bifunctional adenosylcobinamide kinase/adenosylcobinamide-phosphate guanylyltransferase [Emcibacter nanhaiensis]TPD60641.1 bifunctional adenosylcobinamide kinase/adenosylcobinamide-phosphate guanylyltransferase [Emcibacter nanhaiensis]